MAIAFFYTWTTYGTWLPGDQRGWFQRGVGKNSPNHFHEIAALLRMTANAVILNPGERRVVEKTIADHCLIRHWTLHSVNCRSNHVHAVITAEVKSIELPREQFKAWCSRKLNENRLLKMRNRVEEWWTERGWDEYIDDENSLVNVNTYVMEGQDS
jgi:REP element-mobilizing transposase RayT